jgi:protein-disulfide isomerase
MSKKQIYLLMSGGCLLALCFAGALFVGYLYVISSHTTRPVADVVIIVANPRPNEQGNSMGDPNAPVQIVEFSDFQCPFCKRYHMETESLLVKHYVETGMVHFTYRSMGNFISQIRGYENTESRDAALAAYCAADQDKFWEMHDMLFANNRDVENAGSFTSRRLSEIAKSSGLDMFVFLECFDSGKYNDRVQQDHDDAISVGIQGIPSFMVTYEVQGEIKSLLIEGAQPYHAFQQTLDQILEEIGR